MVIALAVLVGAIHSAHIYHLFENDRYFSALSSLERDLSFRTEMGLYYSYYKTVIEASSFTEGVNRLVYDNITEYPDTINTLKRFNLYPEVVLGGMYRVVSRLMTPFEIKSVECYQIQRGYGQPPIETCSGIGDPHYFYIYCVFGLNSLLPVAILLLSLYLSENLLGGIVSVLMFFYNHGEATRVMWTPPLRESFSMPFLYLQLLVLTWIIKKKSSVLTDYILYGVISLLFMLPWQFAQFTLLTQVLCLQAVYSIRLIPQTKFIALLCSLGLSLLFNTVLQFGNTLLLFSYLAFSIPACLVIASLQNLFNKLHWTPLIAFCELIVAVTFTVIMKGVLSFQLGIQDDAHIGAILLSKFTSYQDFHTQLYTCSAEFDFISLNYFGKLSLTLLFPIVFLIISNIGWQTLLLVFNGNPQIKEEISQSHENKSNKKNVKVETTAIEAAYVYHALQCLCFSGMAILLMRLKLFLTPQMSILAGLLTNTKVFRKLSGNHRVSMTYILIIISSISGLWNLSDQMNIIGEYNNPEMEGLVNWINSSTSKDAVFAGGMPIMATVKLTTGRPIVNHPHYEHSGIRERTKLIYTIYSKRDAQEIFNNLRRLQVQYIIMEDIWCNKQYRQGCAFHDIYLMDFPQDKNQPIFCLLVTKKIPPQFKEVFINKNYQVLQLVT